MLGLILGLIGLVGVGAFIWSHDADVARKAAEKQRLADEKVYAVCVKDKDAAVDANAKMKIASDIRELQVKELDTKVREYEDTMLRMKSVRVKEAIKAQDKIRKYQDETVDLEVALKQRNENMTCDPRIVQQLKAALVQQRRDHPMTAEEVKAIMGIDRPVTIKPK